MTKFKVGDEVTFEGADCTGIIKRIDGETLWCDWSDGDKNLNVPDYQAILIKRGKGRPAKVDIGKEYKIFKTSCNNHEENITAKNDKEARKQFTKDYKNREGYELHKVLITSVEESKVVFK